MISLNIEKTFGFISKEKVSAYEAEVKAAQEMLEKGTGKENCSCYDLRRTQHQRRLSVRTY